jgi:hypothetical protein
MNTVWAEGRRFFGRRGGRGRQGWTPSTKTFLAGGHIPPAALKTPFYPVLVQNIFVTMWRKRFIPSILLTSRGIWTRGVDILPPSPSAHLCKWGLFQKRFRHPAPSRLRPEVFCPEGGLKLPTPLLAHVWSGDIYVTPKGVCKIWWR